MTYATVDDIKAKIPAHDLQLLTDRGGAADTIDDAVIQAALNDAAAECNSYISARATLPLANPPHMLNVVCRDLARWRLHADVGRVTETEEKLRDAAIAYLTAVKEGELSLGDETGGEEKDTSPGMVLDDGPDRVMTRDTLRGF